MSHPCTLFTVGPVMMSEEIRAIGAEQPPYFRTAEFSGLMGEAEERYLRLLNAPEGARAVFLSSSGTGGMEAMTAGLLNGSDRALIVDGGSFGHRFAELAAFHGIPAEVAALRPGERLTEERLNAVNTAGLTALLVNLHETSTGTLYDLDVLSRFCRAHDLLLVVDAVSAFVCEELDMKRSGADAVLTASQKALACAPGIAPVALSPRALARTERINSPCYYLNLRSALDNGRRGQPPFTLTESVMMQVSARLKELDNGGLERERERMAADAASFRERIAGLPLELLSQSPSNGCTALCTQEGVSAHGVFETLRREYDLCVCPNGGALRDTVFRVGHMGALTGADYDRLIAALHDLNRRGLL